MSNIILLSDDDYSDLIFTRNSLIGLRKCYPNFDKWFDNKILPNVKNKSRKVFLATNNMGFSGALILKDDKQEKKICTLFINEENRFNHLGSDFLRIASEELQTYKLNISVSDEVKDKFFNSQICNFYTKEKKLGLYKEDMFEYVGYIMYHNPDNIFKRRVCQNDAY